MIASFSLRNWIEQKRIELKRSYIKLLLQRDSARTIAFSFAFGSFVALMPTPLFGVFVALGISLIFKQLNKIAIVVAFLVWNPLLLGMMYSGIIWFVNKVLHSAEEQLPVQDIQPIEIQQEVSSFSETFLFIKEVFWVNLFVALFISTVCYFILFRIIRYRQAKQIAKRVKRKRRMRERNQVEN